MRRIAELMHIAPAIRREFMERELHPDEQTLGVLWACGIRNQQYFGMSNLLIKSFEYDGTQFREDMARMTDYLASRGQLVEKRRKDVPPELWDEESWWAPMKLLGQFLTEPPVPAPVWEDDTAHSIVDIGYNDEDWVSDFHF